MSDAQALVPVDFTQLPSTQIGSDDAFDERAARLLVGGEHPVVRRHE